MPIAVSQSQPGIMVLGIGNILHGDDGVGIHVVKALEASDAFRALEPPATLCDGGTIGLALLPGVQDASGVIVVDASEIGEAPGSVRVLTDTDMDHQLGGRKRTVHEVALADLMSAAALSGGKPIRRALVAIQPSSTDWSMTPTDPVTSAIPQACAAVLNLIEGWNRVD